tara:strand:- start:3327 stop:4169 length:843 start_codon:yes stop_codon:yes gene_type:complete
LISRIDKLKTQLTGDREIPRRKFLRNAVATAAGVGLLGTKAFGQGKPINARDLYEELKKIPELKPIREPVFSKYPYNPIIILIEDLHYSPKEEYKQLEILRKKFGINLVGTEGWAGPKADKKRGFKMNFSEVKKLVNNLHYRIVGLEDPYLHEFTIKFVALLIYFKGFKQPRSKRGASFMLKRDLKIEPTQENIEKIITEAENFLKINLHRGDKNAYETLKSLTDRFLVEMRNPPAAKLMFEAMKKYHIQIGAIVFGKKHITGLIKELRKLWDFNIIVII